MKKCLGCNREYRNDVWLHKELNICSICFRVHIHSTVKEWNPKEKCWVPKNKNNLEGFL